MQEQMSDTSTSTIMSSGDAELIKAAAAAVHALHHAHKQLMAIHVAFHECTCDDAWDRATREIRDALLPDDAHAKTATAVFEAFDELLMEMRALANRPSPTPLAATKVVP